MEVWRSMAMDRNSVMPFQECTITLSEGDLAHSINASNAKHLSNVLNLDPRVPVGDIRAAATILRKWSREVINCRIRFATKLRSIMFATKKMQRAYRAYVWRRNYRLEMAVKQWLKANNAMTEAELAKKSRRALAYVNYIHDKGFYATDSGDVNLLTKQLMGEQDTRSYDRCMMMEVVMQMYMDAMAVFYSRCSQAMSDWKKYLSDREKMLIAPEPPQSLGASAEGGKKSPHATPLGSPLTLSSSNVDPFSLDLGRGRKVESPLKTMRFQFKFDMEEANNRYESLRYADFVRGKGSDVSAIDTLMTSLTEQPHTTPLPPPAAVVVEPQPQSPTAEEEQRPGPAPLSESTFAATAGPTNEAEEEEESAQLERQHSATLRVFRRLTTHTQSSSSPRTSVSFLQGEDAGATPPPARTATPPPPPESRLSLSGEIPVALPFPTVQEPPKELTYKDLPSTGPRMEKMLWTTHLDRYYATRVLRQKDVNERARQMTEIMLMEQQQKDKYMLTLGIKPKNRRGLSPALSPLTSPSRSSARSRSISPGTPSLLSPGGSGGHRAFGESPRRASVSFDAAPLPFSLDGGTRPRGGSSSREGSRRGSVTPPRSRSRSVMPSTGGSRLDNDHQDDLITFLVETHPPQTMEKTTLKTTTRMEGADIVVTETVRENTVTTLLRTADQTATTEEHAEAIQRLQVEQARPWTSSIRRDRMSLIGLYDKKTRGDKKGLEEEEPATIALFGKEPPQDMKVRPARLAQPSQHLKSFQKLHAQVTGRPALNRDLRDKHSKIAPNEPAKARPCSAPLDVSLTEVHGRGGRVSIGAGARRENERNEWKRPISAVSNVSVTASLNGSQQGLSTSALPTTSPGLSPLPAHSPLDVDMLVVAGDKPLEKRAQSPPQKPSTLSMHIRNEPPKNIDSVVALQWKGDKQETTPSPVPKVRGGSSRIYQQRHQQQQRAASAFIRPSTTAVDASRESAGGATSGYASFFHSPEEQQQRPPMPRPETPQYMKRDISSAEQRQRPPSPFFRPPSAVLAEKRTVDGHKIAVSHEPSADVSVRIAETRVLTPPLDTVCSRVSVTSPVPLILTPSPVLRRKKGAEGDSEESNFVKQRRAMLAPVQKTKLTEEGKLMKRLEKVLSNGERIISSGPNGRLASPTVW